MGMDGGTTNLYRPPSFRRSVSPMENRCTSCGAVLIGKGTTSFLCPSCGQGRIGRCARCRDQSVEFQCPNCGFQGP